MVWYNFKWKSLSVNYLCLSVVVGYEYCYYIFAWLLPAKHDLYLFFFFPLPPSFQIWTKMVSHSILTHFGAWPTSTRWTMINVAIGSKYQFHCQIEHCLKFTEIVVVDMPPSLVQLSLFVCQINPNKRRNTFYLSMVRLKRTNSTINNSFLYRSLFLFF